MRNTSVRLVHFEQLAGLFLLVRGEGGLAAKLDTVRLGVGGRDAGLAVNMRPILHQKSVSKKPNSINGVPQMQKS